MATKAQIKKNEARVSKIFRGCSEGIQIDIFDISKVMKCGMEGIEQGLDDDALTVKIKAFLQTIRKN